MRVAWMVVCGLAGCGKSNSVASDASPADDSARADARIVDAFFPDVIVHDAAPDVPGPMVTIGITEYGPGTGTLVANGTPCPTPCSFSVPLMSTAVVEAIPDSDSFGVWNSPGCTAPGNTCTFVAYSSTTFPMSYAWPVLSLTPDQRDGSGTVSAGGTACSGPCSISAKAGTQVTFSAAGDPTTHSVLHRWSDPACGSNAMCTYTVAHVRRTNEYAYFGRDNSVDNGTTTFTATKSGSPLWTVGGFKIVSTYGNAFSALQALWQGHSYNSSTNTFYPGTAHAGPYDSEAGTRSTALEWDDGSHFPEIDWSVSANRTLQFVGTIVPSAGAPTGSTKDYASGPYIPRDLELYVDGDMYKNNTLIDPDFDQPYGSLAQADPSSTENGWSHMTISLGENESFITGTKGNYHLHIHIYEVATPANGWNVDIPFVIDP